MPVRNEEKTKKTVAPTPVASKANAATPTAGKTAPATKKSALRVTFDELISECGMDADVVEVAEKKLAIDGSKVDMVIAEFTDVQKVKDLLFYYMTCDKKMGSNIQVDVMANPLTFALMKMPY